ncbi:hypothetical protein SRHO_G00031860 [Serrasalmus rhombeus]
MAVLKQMRTLSPLSIILLGEKQSGRSSAGNTILGRSEFQVDGTLEPLTVGSGDVEGRGVTVVNTTGWKPGCHPKVPLRILDRGCGHVSWATGQGPHALLLTIPIYFKMSWNKKAAKRLLKLFDDNIWRHTIVLFTKADQLGLMSLERYLEGSGRPLQALVEKCERRYHALNNQTIDNRKQVIELLDKIDQMVAENGGKTFQLIDSSWEEKAMVDHQTEAPKMNVLEEQLKEMMEQQAKLEEELHEWRERGRPEKCMVKSLRQEEEYPEFLPKQNNLQCNQPLQNLPGFCSEDRAEIPNLYSEPSVQEAEFEEEKVTTTDCNFSSNEEMSSDGLVIRTYEECNAEFGADISQINSKEMQNYERPIDAFKEEQIANKTDCSDAPMKDAYEVVLDGAALEAEQVKNEENHQLQPSAVLNTPQNWGHPRNGTKSFIAFYSQINSLRQGAVRIDVLWVFICWKNLNPPFQTASISFILCCVSINKSLKRILLSKQPKTVGKNEDSLVFPMEQQLPAKERHQWQHQKDLVLLDGGDWTGDLDGQMRQPSKTEDDEGITQHNFRVDEKISQYRDYSKKFNDGTSQHHRKGNYGETPNHSKRGKDVERPHHSNKDNDVKTPQCSNKDNDGETPQCRKKGNDGETPQYSKKSNGAKIPQHSKKDNDVETPQHSKKDNDVKTPQHSKKENDGETPQRRKKGNDGETPQYSKKSNGAKIPQHSKKDNDVETPQHSKKDNDVKTPQHSKKENDGETPQRRKKGNDGETPQYSNKSNGAKIPQHSKKDNDVEIPQHSKKENDVKTPQHSKKENDVEIPQHSKKENDVKTPQHSKKENDVKTPQHSKKENDVEIPQHSKKENDVEIPQHSKKENYVKTPQHSKKENDGETPQHSKKDDDVETPQHSKKENDGETPQRRKKGNDGETPQYSKKSNGAKIPQHSKKDNDVETPQHSKKDNDVETPQHSKKDNDVKTPQHSKKDNDVEIPQHSKKENYVKTPQHSKKENDGETPQHSKKDNDVKTPQHSKKDNDVEIPQHSKKENDGETPQYSKKSNGAKIPQHSKKDNDVETPQHSKKDNDVETPQHSKKDNDGETPQCSRKGKDGGMSQHNRECNEGGKPQHSRKGNDEGITKLSKKKDEGIVKQSKKNSDRGLPQHSRKMNSPTAAMKDKRTARKERCPPASEESTSSWNKLNHQGDQKCDKQFFMKREEFRRERKARRSQSLDRIIILSCLGEKNMKKERSVRKSRRAKSLERFIEFSLKVKEKPAGMKDFEDVGDWV